MVKGMASVRSFFRNIPLVYHIRRHFLLPKYKVLRELLFVKDVENMRYIRMGRDGDGGYVVADHFPKGVIAYSFGISTDVSFEKDIARRGIEVFMYDHTIYELPESDKKFHFNKLGIAGVSGGDLRTMEELIQMNGHEAENNILLKMDVEGWEWDFLCNSNRETMKKFSQIIFEMHDLTKLSKFDKISTALRKLNETHQLVHIHANNYSSYKTFDGVNYPKMLEVTYLRKSDHKFIESKRTFPTPLDMPNSTAEPDFELGAWNI